MKREELETSRLKIQSLITDLTLQAESWAESGAHLRGEQRFVRARRTSKLFFDNEPETENHSGENKTARKSKRRNQVAA